MWITQWGCSKILQTFSFCYGNCSTVTFTEGLESLAQGFEFVDTPLREHKTYSSIKNQLPSKPHQCQPRPQLWAHRTHFLWQYILLLLTPGFPKDTEWQGWSDRACGVNVEIRTRALECSLRNKTRASLSQNEWNTSQAVFISFCREFYQDVIKYGFFLSCFKSF